MVSTAKGLVLTLNVEEPGSGDSRRFSRNDIVAVRYGESRWGGRVASVAHRRRSRSGAAVRERSTIKVEIPDKSHAAGVLCADRTIKLESAADEVVAGIVSVTEEDVRPLSDAELEALAERDFNAAIKVKVARKLTDVIYFERSGGGLGQRDRFLIGLLIENPDQQSDMLCRTAVMHGLLFHGVDFDGVGSFGIDKEVLDGWKISASETDDLTPCSGLWRAGHGLLSVLDPTPTGEPPAQVVLNRLRQVLARFGISSAAGVWEINRDTVYTLDDVSYDAWKSRSDTDAVEAFLHALKARTDPSVDIPTHGVPERPVQEDFRDAAGAVRRLANRLVPQATDEDVAELERAIRQAQKEPPLDKAAFVQDVNKLLTVLGLRIRADGTDVGRLRLANKYTIQLTLPGKGGSRSFRDAEIKLVRIPSNYVGNRWNADGPGKTP